MNNQVEKIQTGITLNMETGEYEPVFAEVAPVVAEVKSVEKTEEKADKKIVKMRVTKSAKEKRAIRVEKAKTGPFVGARHEEVMTVLAELPPLFKRADFMRVSKELLGYEIPFNMKVREYYTKKENGKYSIAVEMPEKV